MTGILGAVKNFLLYKRQVLLRLVLERLILLLVVLQALRLAIISWNCVKIPILLFRILGNTSPVDLLLTAYLKHPRLLWDVRS